jgi:hypothetical protein
MQSDITKDFQQFNCLNVLERMLALAMQTAEAASAEKNHKLVLQAVREVTRLVTLINKINVSPDQKPKAKPVVGPTPGAELPMQPGKWEKSGKTAGKQSLIERFFKENKSVSGFKKKVATSSQTSAGVNPSQPTNHAPGAIRWQDDPVTLVAEEAAAA